MEFIRHLYSGRIDRKHFVVLALIMMAVNAVAELATFRLGVYLGPLQYVVSLLLGILISIVSLHLFVRRLHDINLSGWLVLPIYLIAMFFVFIGNIVWLVFFVFLVWKKGDEGQNTYGGPPAHASYADAFLNQ